MTLKQSWVSRATRALKLSVAGIALLATAGGLTAGCLDRPVAPAVPRTSNVVVKTVTQSGVDKIDLLFMIDNSISMADKQRILAQAVPVLVQRLVDPVCVDADGNPVGTDTAMGGCMNGQPEFSPIENIHVGVITSSLGNHGGEVCTPNPTEVPPRTLNDAAQLMPSVRPDLMLYSYSGLGFLAWDPRMGQAIPVPDPHPGKGQNETDAAAFVTQFTTHVTSTGERGCGYESSLEAWYRFLIDPEPVNTVTNDGQFSVRGPVNQIVLDQRARFMRPDSLLAVIMLTDENDCSIADENGQQGWLVGSRNPMPRGSDACARPDDPNIYRCCIPCVLLSAGAQLPDGCSYGGDVACGMSPDGYLPPIEDSTNLRCYQQVRRFGVNLLYPWQRYVFGLTQPRIPLRPPSTDEVTNPLYTPGMDGTPAREQGLVFLAGIIGVPWQDIATPETLNGRALRYITAPNMAQPLDANGMASGPNRWDVILGDPDTGRPPSDPFMLEMIDQRMPGLTNPIVPTAAIIAANGTGMNAINGHEQNVVNRDDLQYACIFDLDPDVACTMMNQDGCDCNASEQAYNRPLCQYTGMGTDGTQTFAKAYPGTRHLQVLKGFGNNAIVASICPKNVQPMGNMATDPDYGYNPAVGAIIERLKEALIATCLPRPLVAENDEVPCTVVEAFQPGADGVCSCNQPGRLDLAGETKNVRGAVEDELRALSLCGGGDGAPSCASYCMCEIQQFSGGDLNTCQNDTQDLGNIYGYCYVDPDNGQGNPDLVADCPDTQRQIIRFMGNDVPRPKALGFIACLGASVSSGTGPDSGM